MKIDDPKTVELFDRISTFLISHGAVKVAIFGSYARGEQRADSDIDVMVEFNDVKSILEIVGLEIELSDLLGKNVELLTRASISPYMIDDIEKEMVVLNE